VASIENNRISLNLGDSQGKSVYVLDVNNVFQNTIQFDPTKRTYNMIPTFFAEYLRLHWLNHPDLDAITADPHIYALQKFLSMQGEKDAGRRWYQLLHGALTNVGLYHSASYHDVFTWKQDPSEMFVAIATDDCMCVCDDHSQFLCLKQRLEELFVLTLQ
jgi:hypothetical protein